MPLDTDHHVGVDMSGLSREPGHDVLHRPLLLLLQPRTRRPLDILSLQVRSERAPGPAIVIRRAFRRGSYAHGAYVVQINAIHIVALPHVQHEIHDEGAEGLVVCVVSALRCALAGELRIEVVTSIHHREPGMDLYALRMRLLD